MKSLVSRMAVLMILGTSLCGCRTLMDTAANKQPIQAPPLKVTQKVTPVQPEEITPANARAKAHQLLEEMEQDSGKGNE
jgi:hypothetical protein